MLTQCLGRKLGKSLNSYVGYNFIEGNHLWGEGGCVAASVAALARVAPPAVAAQHTASSAAPTPFKGILGELPPGPTSHLHSLA